ncbi:hypothetical protein T484DRAFT_2842731 [Baffinella frigidus]|nr:hypothetical protein T484DRAFT_2842731 [Cryptophyta sp. CCMP2293]
MHHAPYTLHPTPYTLHRAPYTLHPTPYTLHPTPYSPLQMGPSPQSHTTRPLHERNPAAPPVTNFLTKRLQFPSLEADQISI